MRECARKTHANDDPFAIGDDGRLQSKPLPHMEASCLGFADGVDAKAGFVSQYGVDSSFLSGKQRMAQSHFDDLDIGGADRDGLDAGNHLVGRRWQQWGFLGQLFHQRLQRAAAMGPIAVRMPMHFPTLNPRRSGAAGCGCS